jgi:hypothetical protein
VHVAVAAARRAVLTAMTREDPQGSTPRVVDACPVQRRANVLLTIAVATPTDEASFRGPCRTGQDLACL